MNAKYILQRSVNLFIPNAPFPGLGLTLAVLAPLPLLIFNKLKK